MTEQPCWWDQIEMEEYGKFPEDGDYRQEDIPPQAWSKHRKLVETVREKYRLADEPCEIFAIAGVVMIGYPPRAGSK